MATYKNDIILIAGSGDFAFEAANYLNSKNRLNQIILLSKNSKISKIYKNTVSYFDIRDIENLVKFLKEIFITKVLIIGYVQLPPIKEIKLSLTSKLVLSKNFFLNDINNQSKILKKFIESKNLKLLSQKIIFNDLLINYSDQNIKNDHKNIHKYILKNSSLIRKIFSLNLSQSLVMDGDRIITIEDIFGTNNMINKFKSINKNFKNLIFIKSIKKDQINEIDFPIIGSQTLELLIKYKFKNLNKEFKNLIFIKSIKKDQINEIDFPIIGNQTLDLLIKFNFKAVCLLNKKIIVANKSSFIENINKSKLSLIVI